MVRNLTVNANKTRKVYLVIITSKDSFVTHRNNFEVHGQKCSKEKTLKKIRKTKSHTSLQLFQK